MAKIVTSMDEFLDNEVDDSSSNILNVTPETLQKLQKELEDQNEDMAKRMRNIFTLRNICTDACVEAMVPSLQDPSALLAHEIAYCLGQMQNKIAVPHLISALQNESLNTMVRHEAAEALGAIGDKSALPSLEQFKDCNIPEVAETCIVSLDLIKWREETKGKGDGVPNDIYMSIDPAPPSQAEAVEKLRETLLDKSKSIFKRYRALFALRNDGSKEAVLAICDGFYNEDSALFKHELAYVLGQIQSEHAVPALKEMLMDVNQHDMVRHEAAEALGSIADDSILPLLKDFAKDNVAVVKESCTVALDLHEYYSSDTFQYADGLAKAE